MKNIPALRNVEIFFLPPNRASRTAPLDAVVIAAVKILNHHLFQYCRLENIDAQQNKIFKVDILTAIEWIHEEWNTLLMSTLEHCWKHCFPVDPFEEIWNIDALENAINHKTRSELGNTAKDFNVNYIHPGIEKLLHVEDESNVLQDISVQGLVEEIVSAEQNDNSQDVESFQIKDIGIKLSLQDKMKALRTFVQLFQQNHVLHKAIRQYLLRYGENSICRRSNSRCGLIFRLC